MESRTLYNLLRMNWLRDPTIKVEAWQVYDYRQMPLDEIFLRLNQHDVPVDRTSFHALAQELESPEELTEQLLADAGVDAATHDQIYMLLFELWRRLVPERLCLSVFCDELDHQIDLYDRGELTDAELLQDVLANFEMLLEDNTGEENDPREVFASIGERCANDLESFLYDFISDQIDSKNISYAGELLEDFGPYISDVKWFDLLKLRIISFTDIPSANIMARQLARLHASAGDPDFNLELIAALVNGGERDLFNSLLKQTVPMLHTEEELQDLISICADYFHFLDDEQQEMALQKMLQERATIPLTQPLQRDNVHVKKLAALCKI